MYARTDLVLSILKGLQQIVQAVLDRILDVDEFRASVAQCITQRVESLGGLPAIG